MIEINSSLSLDPKELIWAEGHINYTKFYFKNQKSELHPITLKSVEEKLEDFSFYRIHRKNLINLSFVENTDLANQKVKLSGYNVSIARRRKNEFVRLISE